MMTMLKKSLPFIVVLLLVLAAGLFARSWAAVALIMFCLFLYYIRLYIRKVLVPTRELHALKKQLAEQEAAERAEGAKSE